MTGPNLRRPQQRHFGPGQFTNPDTPLRESNVRRRTDASGLVEPTERVSNVRRRGQGEEPTSSPPKQWVNRTWMSTELRGIIAEARSALAVSSGLEPDLLAVVLTRLDVLGLSLIAGAGAS